MRDVFGAEWGQYGYSVMSGGIIGLTSSVMLPGEPALYARLRVSVGGDKSVGFTCPLAKRLRLPWFGEDTLTGVLGIS